MARHPSSNPQPGDGNEEPSTPLSTPSTPTPDSAPPGLLIYQSPDGTSRIHVRLDQETLWLSQRQLADLFQKSVPTINEHIQGIFAEGELPPEATIRKYRIVQTEGSREVERLVDHYSLDVVIAVGYRVRSTRGTQFRQWATATLREYLIKGFALDDTRLKEGKNFGSDYFDE
ncbi:MAG: virulence RhuM family protein, partial [Planctomycetota bacterium]|nr:virulence RhuM family protein [Planctomycetota bacterium]